MPSVAVAVAGVVALLGMGATVGNLVYLHVVPTGLSPIRNAVSQYGITAYRAGYRAATISFGVAGVALAVGVAEGVHGKGKAVVVAFLLVFTLGRLAISWFPMDHPDAPRTSTGHVHGLIAIVTFGAATVAALRLGSVLTAGAPWHALAPVSTGLAWAMVLCIAGMLLGRSGSAFRNRFGAIERVLYVVMIGWFTVFAGACALRVH